MYIAEDAVEIILEDLSDEKFNLHESVTRSREILADLADKGVMVSGDFKDDKWTFTNRLVKGQFINFDFYKIPNFRFEGLQFEVTVIIKCWLAELLDLYYPPTVYEYYYHILYVLEETCGFSKDQVEHFISHLQKADKSKEVKAKIIGATFHFFDYTDLEAASLYVPKLLVLRKKMKLKRTIRKLPPSKEILKFSYCIDSFFTEDMDKFYKDDEVKKKRVLYYPLWLWWNLTTIIPMRASEFCLLERDCLVQGSYKIRLPREKQKNSKRIQVFDTVEIKKEVYELFSDYIELTDPHGTTNTLVSYRALIWADETSGYTRTAHKRDLNYFSRTILKNLIARFYDEIVRQRYHYSIGRNNEVKPNDTRHLAFISLMMQGISPIEIARLGGHQTIAAQYHYQQHTEYWVDSEVFKLMKKYKFMEQNDKSPVKSSNIIPSEIKLKAYQPTKSTFKRELNIGYCTDELQRCQTDECILCPAWRISPEELLLKEHLIAEKYAKRRKNLEELIAFLQNVNRILLADDITRLDPKTFTEMKSTGMQIEEEINAIAKMEVLLSRGKKHYA